MAWLTICGETNLETEETLKKRVLSKISTREFTEENVAYIRDVNLEAIEGSASLTDDTLERLRRMCQVWDADLRPFTITSHRKFVGPIIVGAKKLLFPIFKGFLKDFISQQKSFNAEVLSYLTWLSHRIDSNSIDSNSMDSNK